MRKKNNDGHLSCNLQTTRRIENKVEYCFEVRSARKQTRSIEAFVFYLELFYIMIPSSVTTQKKQKKKKKHDQYRKEQMAHTKE